MVDKIELVWALAFGVLIGWFFGFVLSGGSWMIGGASALALVVIALIYAVKFSEADAPHAI